MNNNIKEPIGKDISQIYRKGRAFISKGLTQYDMGYGQMLFLLQLYNQDGISQEELTEKLNIDKGTTAKAVKKLEELGFVTRFKDSTDKRINRIYLTSKAFNIKNDFFSVLTKWENMLTNELSPEEISESLTILNKLSKNVTRNN